MIQKAYKFRLLPNKTQEVLLAKTFGCCRYFWNHCVEQFNKPANEEKKYLTVKEMRNETGWMKEVSYCAVAEKRRDFDQFKNQFFSKSRKKKIGRPQFKSKYDRKQSFRLPFGGDFYVKGNKIFLVKLGLVKCVVDQKIPEDVKVINCTVSKDSVGDYFVSITVEENNIKQLPKTGKATGIDVGLTNFITLSDGTVVDNPRFFRENQAKLKRAQQHLSRKVKGSNRQKKCRRYVAKVHRKIARQRSDFLNRLSILLVKEYDLIAVEDLNIAGMLKNHCLAKNISDASWSEFIRMLEYKCVWYGKDLRKIGRFEPTSKKCYKCGYIYKDMDLSIREWDCPICGTHHHRDHTAAINILDLAVGTDTALQTWRECKTFEECHSSAVPCEASMVTEDL